MKKIKLNVSANESMKYNRKPENKAFINAYVFPFTENFRATAFGFFLAVSAAFNFACASPSLKANQSKPAANRQMENNLPSFENDLQSMRNANFDFIYVFRRRDGGALDSEDKKYLKANSPVATNRFVLTDENKAAIAGSSYKFEPENLDSLQKRFVVENFSKPEGEPMPADENSGK